MSNTTRYSGLVINNQASTRNLSKSLRNSTILSADNSYYATLIRPEASSVSPFSHISGPRLWSVMRRQSARVAHNEESRDPPGTPFFRAARWVCIYISITLLAFRKLKFFLMRYFRKSASSNLKGR